MYTLLNALLFTCGFLTNLIHCLNLPQLNQSTSPLAPLLLFSPLNVVSIVIVVHPVV